MSANSKLRRRVTRRPARRRDPFEKLLDGEYPVHLGKDLLRLATTDEKLSAVRARVDLLDQSPAAQLPFERRILGAIEKDLRSAAPRNFILHNQSVFELMGVIFDRLTEIHQEAPGIADGLKGRKEQLLQKLRLAAFLHDTGKALEQSRHPILGWHVLLDLASVGKADQEAKKFLDSNLRKLDASKPEAAYRWLARLIRDHDKFGVISTGEASYVILGSLMRYGRGGPETSLSQLRDTWLLNLADICGTTLARPTRAEEKLSSPLQRALFIRADKFEALTSDWTIVHQIVRRAPSFTAALEALRQASETPEYTAKRIRRLLLERAGTWETLANYFTEDLIEDALETHFAPRDLLTFCRELGMVAKLDYALQFWNELADYFYVKLAVNEDISQTIYDGLVPKGGDWTKAFGDYNSGRDPSSWYGVVADLIRQKPEEGIHVELAKRARRDRLEESIARKQADLLIAILRRVVVAYRGLIRGRNVADTAAIGVGFSYLRSDEREKRLALYELLTGDGRERGLRWLIDEIASWDMLA